MLVERELTIQDFEDSLELKFRSVFVSLPLNLVYRWLFCGKTDCKYSHVFTVVLMISFSFLNKCILNNRPQGSAGPPVPTPPHKLTFAFKFKVFFVQTICVYFSAAGAAASSHRTCTCSPSTYYFCAWTYLSKYRWLKLSGLHASGVSSGACFEQHRRGRLHAISCGWVSCTMLCLCAVTICVFLFSGELSRSAVS